MSRKATAVKLTWACSCHNDFTGKRALVRTILPAIKLAALNFGFAILQQKTVQKQKESAMTENTTLAKVDSLDLAGMKNALFVEFMMKFKSIINEFIVVKEKIAPLPTQLDALMEKLNTY